VSNNSLFLVAVCVGSGADGAGDGVMMTGVEVAGFCAMSSVSLNTWFTMNRGEVAYLCFVT